MEAIQIVDGEKDNKVVTEPRPGYLMHGSVLRPAQVTVSKKKSK
jgi:molecular chaperone GrpE (heat shock protein)